jgi:uncharacterized protein (TIGR02147 family)
MVLNIYSFENYKAYLAKLVAENSQNQKGYRADLCEAVGCQPSYLSQVLNGKPDFTLEQAHKLNKFFAHEKNEAKYFLLLVEFARAGTPDLRKFFRDEIEQLQQDRMNLKKRLKETEDVPLEYKQKYYSTWYYAAIHIALAVPEFQNPQKIAEQFRLPLQVVNDVIHFLQDAGLIENIKGKYHFTKRRLHLGADSAFVQGHHIHWRSQALQSVEKNMPDDLHFSTVFAIAHDDFKKIKEILVSSIESARAVIKPSESEQVCAITLDFFAL